MPKKSISKEDTLKLPEIKKRDKEELIETQRRLSMEKMAMRRRERGPSFDVLTPIEEGSREEDSEESQRATLAKPVRSVAPIEEVPSEEDSEESRTTSVEPLEVATPIEEESREVDAEESRRTIAAEFNTKEVEIDECLADADDDGGSEPEKSSYTSEDDETTEDDSEEDSEEVSEDSEDESTEEEDSEDDESESEETEDDSEDKEDESDKSEEEEIEEPKEEEDDAGKEEIEHEYVQAPPLPPLQGQELLDHVRELVKASIKAEEEEEKNKPEEPVPILFDIVCDPECTCKRKHKFAELQKINVYRVMSLKKCYSKLRNMSVEEFMSVTLPGMKLTLSEESITRHLLTDMIEHEKFIHAIGNHYYRHRDIRDTRDRNIVEVILYLVLLRLKDATYKTVLKTVCELDPLRGHQILKYITFPDTPSSIQFHAYKFYGHEFVMNKVMRSLGSEQRIMQMLLGDIANFIDSKKPKPTVSKEMKVLEHSMKPSAQQEKQPEEQISDYFKPVPAKPVPKSTHEPPKTQRKLGKLKLQNKSEALKLLQEAQEKAFKCAAPKLLPKVKEPPSVHKIRAAPIPDFSKSPPVKKTTATVLREAARYMRDDAKATQLLKYLEEGGGNMETYQLLQEEIRKRREQEEVEAVERKHLQGLLTREEALLARHALLKERKERMKQFMLEHEEWERQLEELRAREEEKILAMKSKTQGIEQGARDRVQELQQIKRDKAQEMIRETRALLEQKIKEREAELAQRMEMIREMRALHELKCLENKEKEVDFTEPPGLGLMGEMSLAELRERLLLMRMELQDQENERRARIQEEKERIRSLIQNTEEYIQNIHNQKELLKKQKKKVSTAGEKRLDSPALQKLREKIEDARQQRIALAAATS